ncbi:MAG TPA: PIG-L deacetylase family protein [Kofleriaceae bacterium]
MSRLLAQRDEVLAFGAHPDDLEVGAGGLLARLAAAGARVTLVVVSVPSHAEQRIAEAKAGAAILGAEVVIMFPERACRVEDIAMHELVRRFDILVGDLRPELVITHSAHDLHWDHSLVHRATISALRRTPCDLLAYLSSPELNAQSRSLGQCFADVSSTIDTKLAAIRAHATQLGKLDVEASRDLARGLGRISGVAYAEAYEALRLRL